MYGNSQDLVIVIVTGTASILFLAALLIVYIYFYQKRQNSFIEEKEVLQKNFDEVLRQSQIEVQETTMSSLAKELHDNIGQLLSSTKMLLGITQKNLPNVPETLLVADESLGKAINEIRALSKSLSKDWLTQFDLLQNLKTEVTRINASQILHVHLSGPDVIILSTEKQIILFRIIQEALQNAIKHAEANNIHVIIASSKELLTLNIIDDGKGFAEPNFKTGIGLTNMKQRTELLGGTITWKSSQNKGCNIEISIQLKDNDI
jgi:signal transduction histidine kinase